MLRRFPALVAAVILAAVIGCADAGFEYISKTTSDDLRLLFPLPEGDELSGNPLFTDMQILDINPAHYFEQSVPYCGGVSIAGIVSAYGIEDSSGATFMTSWGRLFGGMTPAQAVSVLSRYDIQARIQRAERLTEQERIQLIKDEINSGRPVMLLIGNGFRRDGSYSLLKSQNPNSLHWITVWGYHGSGFFIYDSAVSPENYSYVPIGNSERGYEELLRDWSKPFLLSPILGYTYITVASPLLEVEVF